MQVLTLFLPVSVRNDTDGNFLRCFRMYGKADRRMDLFDGLVIETGLSHVVKNHLHFSLLPIMPTYLVCFFNVSPRTSASY